MKSAITPAAGSAERWGALWGARPDDWAGNEAQQVPTYEEAIRRVCNKSVAEFETELRQWGRAERRVFGGGA